MRVEAVSERFRLLRPFVISRGARTHVEVVTARVGRGRGEGVPYPRGGETVAGVLAALEGLEVTTREALAEAMPPGSARAAVDAALWDDQAKRTGRPAWALAGLSEPGPVVTAYTLSLDEPEAMRAQAAENDHRPLLKVKLGAEGDVPRLEAVRAGAPRPRLIVDANEGWSADAYADLAPHLVRLGVEMVEQPLPAGEDEALAEMPRPVPVCADEACLDRSSLPALRGRYDLVNVKLDKAGGLTEALALIAAARAEGHAIMVGCMLGTSLAMAPAVLAAQGAAVVDLDAPLLLAEDRDPPLAFGADGLHPADPALWG